MDSAYFTINIQNDMPLFKYLSSNSLKYILEGQIRFSQPGSFNDPFELLPEIYHPPDIVPIKVNINFSLDAPRRDLSKFTQLDDFDPKYCNDQISRIIVDTLDKQIGFLCLTENSNSLLMWAHYADEYKGAIIEFEEDHDFFKNKIVVDYHVERPKLSAIYYIEASEPIPIAELCTKSEQWSYENEVRIVCSLNNCKKVGKVDDYDIFVQDIPLTAIKKVFLGERMPVKEQREVFEILKYTNISISLGTIATTHYSIEEKWLKFAAPIPEGGPVISARTAELFKNDSGTNAKVAKFMIKNSPHKGITKR